MGKIYHNNPNLLNELLLKDYIRKLEPLFRMGWHLRPEDGKLALIPGHHGIDHGTNWIHTNPDPERRCRFYQLIFEHCDFVPLKCMNCWKVVVRPKSLLQLLKLYELQERLAEENPKCWSKCGWEDRPWVSGNYGGYFYCSSKAVGWQRYQTVRKGVDEYIGKHVDVLLKRFCTEFEVRSGDSAKYQRPKEADIMETSIFEGSYIERLANPQPESLKDHIMSEWILNAYSIGDPTAIFYNNNKPLYTPVHRYEGEFEKEVSNGKSRSNKGTEKDSAKDKTG